MSGVNNSDVDDDDDGRSYDDDEVNVWNGMILEESKKKGLRFVRKLIRII